MKSCDTCAHADICSIKSDYAAMYNMIAIEEKEDTLLVPTIFCKKYSKKRNGNRKPFMKNKPGNHHKRTKYRTFQEMVRRTPFTNMTDEYPLEE